jgi:DNA polymerase III beta subunit
MATKKKANEETTTITLPRADWIRVIGTAARAVDKRTPLDAARLVHVSCGAGGIIARGTDLLVYVTSELACDVPACEFALPAGDFMDRLSAMPDGDVKVNVGAESVEIVAGSRRFKLARPSSEDAFPQFRECDAPAFTLDAATLRGAIGVVRHCAGTDVARPHINAVLVEVMPGGAVRTVATDGHRLGLHERGDVGPVKETALLPLRVVDIVAKGEATGPVQCRFGKASVSFTAGTSHVVTTTCALPEGQFPPYQNVIPARSDASKIARVHGASFAAALSAIGATSDARTGGVNLDFVTGRVDISAESAEKGRGDDSVPADYTGKAYVCANAKYLADAVQAIDSDDVELQVGGALEPIVCYSAKGNTRIVVMPMRGDR